MTLKEELGAFAQQMTKNAPAQVLQTMGAEIGKLVESGIADSALKEGSKAPDFELKNSEGSSASLRDFIKHGPVVVNFNRGNWCPFCNIEFQHLQNSIDEIKKAGANLVVISPQLPEKSRELKTQFGFNYPILYDKGNEVAKKFGIAFTLADSLRPIHTAFQMDIPAHNGDESYELPMPATYVVDTNGIILYSGIHPNWMERTEPAEYMELI